jgi:hypothetical protein
LPIINKSKHPKKKEKYKEQKGRTHMEVLLKREKLLKEHLA